jgi:hypothetical protein
MSIIDNQAELDEAKLKVGVEDDPKLINDLAYWEVAEVDHHNEYRALVARAEATLRLHAEAQRWSGLIAAELHRRREEKRSRAGG